MLIIMAETFGEKLKRLLAERGMSQRQLGKESGIDREYINQIIAGKVKNPSMKIAQKLAKGLKISPGIFFDSGSSLNPESAMAVIEAALSAYIPVYAEVSAGGGMEPIDYVATTRARPAPDNLKAFRVRGLCLEPQIIEGDTLIVDTAISPQNNDLVVVIMDGEASVKHYRDTGEDRWLENNEGKFKPEDVHQVGVVVEFNRKRR